MTQPRRGIANSTHTDIQFLPASRQPHPDLRPAAEQPHPEIRPVTGQPSPVIQDASDLNPEIATADKQPHFPLQGYAKGGGITGLIPGKVDPTVADDTVIRAKKGEYMLSVEDVALMGGPEAVETMVKRLREAAGLPTATGPKRHDQPDHMGRMDKPMKKRGIADLPGYASAGLIKTWDESNAASNSELERNFPGSATAPIPTKEQTMADAGLTIARPRGISTIAADNSTPFVPMFSGSPTAPAPAASNVWTETLKNSGQALAAPAPAAATAPARTAPAPITTAAPSIPAAPKTTNRPGIASGMESISQTAVNAGLPAGGSPVGTSTAGPIALVNGALDATAATALRNRVDWSPGSVNVKRAGIADAYDSQVKSADRINAAEKERLQNRSVADRVVDLNRNHNTAGLSDAEKQRSATDAFTADRKGIADVLVNDTVRGGQELDLTGKQYTADKQLEGTQATGDSRVAAAEAKAAGFEAAAKAKAATNEQAAKDSKELIKTYYDSIKDRSLPAGFEGQHMSLAKDLANAEDPNTDFGIYYAPGTNRQGIATKRSVYGPLLARYEQAGYKGGDAHARAYRDLLTLEKTQGVKLHKAFPRLDSLTNRVTKPAEPILGAL